MNGLQSKPSSSPPNQFQAQQYQRSHTPHTRGPTPPQFFASAQEADPQSTQYSGIAFPYHQYTNIPPLVQFGYAAPHDLNKQAYNIPAGGNTSPAVMYPTSSTSVRQQPYFNQSGMRQSGYPLGQPQINQYTQQPLVYMPQQQFSGSAQVIMAANYPTRMSSSAYQNAMPTTQPGMFPLPPENAAATFTPHAHSHIYNNPPAHFYSPAQQQSRPPSASGMSNSGHVQGKKRERATLPIIDPNTGKDIMQDLQKTRSTPPSSGTMASHGTSSGQETNEIAAQFAAQVAQALGAHPVAGGNQQRTEEAAFADQAAHPGGIQHRPPLEVVHSSHPGVQQRSPLEVVHSSHPGVQQRPPLEVAQITNPGGIQQRPLLEVAQSTHPGGIQQRPPSEVVQITHPGGIQQRPPSEVVQITHPGGIQQRPPSEVVQITHSGGIQQRPPSEVVQITHPGGIQQRPPSEVQSTHSGGIQQRPPSEIQITHPGGIQQRPPSEIQSTHSGGIQHRPPFEVVQSTHPGGILQRELSDETKFAEQLAPVIVSTHLGGNQQRALSDAVKKDDRGKKKSKDINRKGETKQGSEMDAFIDLPTEIEASSSVVEKGSEEPTEGTKNQSKVIATEMIVSSSIVNQEPVVTAAAILENVDSSDAGIFVENEKNGNQKQEAPRSLNSHEGRKQYERDYQESLNIPQAPTLKPLDLPDVQFIEKPIEMVAMSPMGKEEKEDHFESATNQERVIDLETMPPPAVNEEALDTIDINIEDVDSSDAILAIKNEKNEKLKLKYKYKEDQWSPINHEGKKQYDRDFLLQLQNAPESTLRPHDLPNIPDIIIDTPMNRDLPENSYVDFTPRYVWPGGPTRSGGGPPRRSSGQRGRGGPGSQAQAKQINLSIQKDIELHHAKEAWKPGHRAEKIDQNDVDTKSEELFKKVRSILNKLTPQKFQTLVAKMQALEIDTEARLKNVIDLVFEKAISEPGFSVAYANMCKCLSMFKVPAESKQGDVNFRALLLTRCQREFEKANSTEKEFDSKRKEIEKATTEEQKQQMKEELEDEESKAKRRSLGNIRFIGELFKLKMLTENIMHDCVFKLLRTKDEENLECLCRLLKTIGKELDTDKAKPRMDQYFVQMQKIVNEKKLSSRVRFMLQDVIELRQGKWVPRRDDNNPKTIDQIHREVAQEAQDRAIFVQTLPQAKPQKGRGRPGQPLGTMGGGTDGGWSTVSRAPLRTDRTIDPTKLKFSKLGDSENIQLGPGGGTARLGWHRGSTGGGARSQEGERPNAPGNRFSALSKADKVEDDSNRRGVGRGGFGRPLPSASNPAQESEREKALVATKNIVGKRASEERTIGREPERAKTIEKPSTPVQELTDDQMLNKTRAIMDEYLHIQDVGEAISCVQELSSSENLHLFVYNALNQVLERSEVARRQTGLLLHDLVKNNVLSVDTYVKGLNEILMFAEDMEIDIPKIWEYLGQLIGPMVQDGSVPLGFLKQVCEPLKANGKSGILVAEILHDASHREGHKKVGRLWVESKLHWSDFVAKNQIDQFLSEKKLEFTKVGNSAPTSPTASMAIPKIEERLIELITKKGCSNEEVFDWIENEVDELTVKQEYFIRALMTAVCKSAVIVGSNNLMKVEKSQIQRRNNLLQKYLDHQANFELQALFALQALVHKLEHPPGVLRELFDILYDEDIISEDAFIQWEKSEDPVEKEGKGVAMKQVVQFFTWLKEAEDDAES